MIERAIALIGQSMALRTPDLARQLGKTAAEVDALLVPATQSGELVTCSVQLGSGEKVIEYRLSAAGPRESLAPALAPERAEQARRAAAERARQIAREDRQPKEATPAMSIADSILAALEKRGPMTLRELRNHVDSDHLGTLCAQLRKENRLVKLGGSTRSTIYGLPRHGDADAKGKPPHRTPAKKKRAAKPARKAKAKRAPARRPQATAPASVAGTFRPALASDGALLLIGSVAGDFELQPAEARVLQGFLARFDLRADA